MAVPIQGSLVIRQSPGRSSSGGISASMCRKVRGSSPTKEGMPMEFSARLSPFASISTVAKSLDSRTMVEKEVRSSAAAASSAMEISLLQRIWRVTGSKLAAGFIGLHSRCPDITTAWRWSQR
jgi:hypothetical protein